MYSQHKIHRSNFKVLCMQERWFLHMGKTLTFYKQTTYRSFSLFLFIVFVFFTCAFSHDLAADSYNDCQNNQSTGTTRDWYNPFCKKHRFQNNSIWLLALWSVIHEIRKHIGSELIQIEPWKSFVFHKFLDLRSGIRKLRCLFIHSSGAEGLTTILSYTALFYST